MLRHLRKILSSTWRLDLTGLSMSSRSRNSRPFGPNEHQKFTDWVDQKMGAPQFTGKLTFDLDLNSGEGHQ